MTKVPTCFRQKVLFTLHCNGTCLYQQLGIVAHFSEKVNQVCSFQHCYLYAIIIRCQMDDNYNC